MKRSIKLFSLGLSSLFALSLFAGCGDGDNNTNNNNTDTNPPDSNPGGEQTLPDLPTPDKQAPAFSDNVATYNVNAELPATNPTQISEELFGVFLEDINYAGYLLDDNMLINGNFDALTGERYGWESVNAVLTVESAGGVLDGNATYHNTAVGANVNPNYAQVTLSAANGGIANTGLGQVPIAVQQGKKYTFSAFVKAPTGGVMKVSVKDDSTVCATADITLSAKNEWVKYVKTVEATETKTSGLKIEITFDAAGTYCLDGVSFETQDATGGIKQYVYDAIAELAPKFVRFPGGCIIEGDGGNGGANTKEVYDWKNSVGAVNTGSNTGDDTVPKLEYTLNDNGTESTAETYGEFVTRTNNLDLWGYNMEYGVGFYEYFVLCENLGASAVPVLNCGFSCQGGAASSPQGLNGRHGKKVKDYIQDAIDLLDFAKGDTSTKWGAIRAAMGHEEPFEMNYLGIGNEQTGAYYTDYYEEFLKDDAFKAALAKYSVKPIVGNGMFRGNCEDSRDASNPIVGTAQSAAMEAKENGIVDKVCDYGVHDQHYYVNYTYLFENYNLYDSYKRVRRNPNDYYEVFVGEYSANAGDGSKKDSYNDSAVDTRTGYPLTPNSLISALSEAAAMTGFERNGDIVKLAAYAPMFGAAKTGNNITSGGNESVNQWGVDMMYYTNTEIVRTANYYVQKMFMHNMGSMVLSKSKFTYNSGVSATFTLPKQGNAGSDVTINKLYYVASLADNGDVIIKIVNATDEATKINFGLSGGTNRGFAYVTELSGSDRNAFNSVGSATLVPVESSIGWTGDSFGYELKPNSLTVLRLPMVPASEAE